MDRSASDLQQVRQIALSFQVSQETMWSSLWPLGHCAVTSLLLCPLLRAYDTDAGWHVVVGLVAGPRALTIYENPGTPRRHAWCEDAAGDIADPTYGQFDRGDALVVLPAHEAGDLGHYASWKMTLDEEDAARHSIVSKNDGWSVHSSVRVFFGLIELGL